MWPQAGGAADAPSRCPRHLPVAGRGSPAATDATPPQDVVNRAFDPVEADRLWVMAVTEHPAGDGTVYVALVLNAYSRRVVGWSIADHIRLGVDRDHLRRTTDPRSA